MTDIPKYYNGAAFGYIYFDDGVTNNSYRE
jgi:hypothetical protein